MDGIDLDIEGGNYKYYPEFITELRRLMDADSSKSYLITGAPQCPFPDHYLGPVKPGTGLYRKKLALYEMTDCSGGTSSIYANYFNLCIPC